MNRLRIIRTIPAVNSDNDGASSEAIPRHEIVGDITDMEYYRKQLEVGNHYGKFQEIADAARKKLGLPPISGHAIAHEVNIVSHDGIAVTIQLTQRALDRLEREKRLRVPTDIPEDGEDDELTPRLMAIGG